MNNRLINLKRAGALTMILAIVLGPSAALAREASPSPLRVEAEPNNTCQTAEALGVITLPFTLNASLDTTPTTLDIDFFRLSVTPNSSVQIDLEGQGNGQGTLGDPFLGVLDANCNVLTLNDDGGGALNARVQLTVPADGVLVVAATSCCDGGLTGTSASGSYRLGVAPVLVIDSIRGRVVDADSGSPLPGDASPFATLRLLRCEAFGCFNVAQQQADGQGQFRFEFDFTGVRLQTGRYQVIALANLYEANQTEPFDVGENEARNLGDIPLSPIPVARSISGRVVDAGTGAPLRGDTTPFAGVQLIRCLDDFSCFFAGETLTDKNGRFHFQGDPFSPLLAGNYRIVAFADQYRQQETDLFTVGEGQDYQAGDVRLSSFPVRITEVRPCGVLPPEGGKCKFSIRITNGLKNKLKGSAWSLVDSFGLGSFTGFTRFQTNTPAQFTLAPNASKVVSFEFRVPAATQNGVFICTQAFVGQGTGEGLFNTVGQRDLFCITKGPTGFTAVTDAQAHELQDRMNTTVSPMP